MIRPTKVALQNQMRFIAEVAKPNDSARVLARNTGLCIYVIERRVAAVRRHLGLTPNTWRAGDIMRRYLGYFTQNRSAS